jgi:hypothetical protein
MKQEKEVSKRTVTRHSRRPLLRRPRSALDLDATTRMATAGLGKTGQGRAAWFGPWASGRQLRRDFGYVAAGREEDARLVMGGNRNRTATGGGHAETQVKDGWPVRRSGGAPRYTPART